jgi:DNA-binding MarR family transcriptional regulator
VPNDRHEASIDTAVGAWAKRCYMAARVVMEDALRPHGLGATQWYVLYHLVHSGPTPQRDLQRFLQVERATLSVVVTTLARKGFVEQIADPTDQRQKVIRLTTAGTRLWRELPELSRIEDTAFGGMDPADLATAVRVLRTATERLSERANRKDDPT